MSHMGSPPVGSPQRPPPRSWIQMQHGGGQAPEVSQGHSSPWALGVPGSRMPLPPFSSQQLELSCQVSRSVGVGARGLWANARGSSACSSSTDTVTMLEIPREEKCSMSLTSWTLKLSLQRQKVVHLRHLPRKRPRFEVHFLHTVPRGGKPQIRLW